MGERRGVIDAVTGAGWQDAARPLPPEDVTK